MVDWSLARRIARLAAGSEPPGQPAPDLEEMASRSAARLSAYTGLVSAAPLPAPERVSRAEWAEVNLEALSRLLDPVGERLEDRMASAGPLAGPLRAAAGATLAAEAGLVMGYLSQRVLGQYELSLLQPELPPRLLLVMPNLGAAARQPGVDPDSFLEWVVLHEVTHVLQFAGVEWLRGHLAGLMTEYLETVEVRINRGAAGGLPSLPDPARIVEAFREGGLAALVQTREQQSILDRVQATMAVVEGYSEHTMDAVGAKVLPAYDGLREAMERRREERSAPERILHRLLGLDLKRRQYEIGKSFCDAVAEAHGLERLNRVWSSPAALPTVEELSDPARWAERVARVDAPPAIASGR